MTQRSKLDQVQAQSQALVHLDALFTHAPFGMVFLDLDLRFVRINDRLAEMNGYSIAAHLGKTVAEIVPTLEATLLEVTARILATGQPVLDQEFTGETVRAPGVTRTWSESWYPARDESGKIIGFSAMVMDITERKQTEAALQLINQRLELAVKASKAVLWQQDLDLRFTWLHNPAPGIDGSDAVGKQEADLLERAEDVAVIEGLKREVIRGGVAMRTQFFPQIQGVVHCFELLMEPLRDAAGHITGLTGAALDITERHQAEAARRESDQRLKQAVAGADLGTWHWDISTGALYWSERCLNIFGIPAGTVMSYEKFLGALHPEDRAHADEAVRHAIQDGSEYRIELRNVWSDGSVHWAISLGRVYRDATGKPIRMEGIALDITERKRMEAALNETELHFQALAEASAEIPYRMSADWSMMMALDGRGFLESADRPVSDWAWVDQYIPPDEQARVRQAISDAIARKSMFELEHRVVRADGSTGWTRSRAVPILDENDDLVTWFGAASNITERKCIELNLIAATAAAEKANLAKSDFLSNITHELRTPLNSILGFAQLIESGTPAPSPVQSKNLEHIIKGGWYLLDLVNDLLDLAQIESGKLPLAQDLVSVDELLNDCRGLIEPQAREREIEMIFPSLALLGHVRADRTRLKQVMLNLLSNAIKYNKAQGAVSVELALISPDAIRVSVRDTGEGLAPEKLSQLFQPFNRLGREAGPLQGTGIGLVMSKRLVELMGGAIGAESVVGVGSVFWLELNWAPAEQVAS